jgi:hypothetical protein
LIEKLQKNAEANSGLNIQFHPAKMVVDQGSESHFFKTSEGLLTIKRTHPPATQGAPNSGKARDLSLNLLSPLPQDPAIIRYSVRKSILVDSAIIRVVASPPKKLASIRRSTTRLNPNALDFVPRKT